jgi:hypothetical protein
MGLAYDRHLLSRDSAEPRVELQGAMSQPYRLGKPFSGY